MASWTVDQEIELIDFYRENEILWNARHTNYYKRDMRHEVHRVFKERFLEKYSVQLTSDSISKKFKNLRSSYMRELKKKIARKKSGSAGSSVYCPRWIHFHRMDFIHDVVEADQSSDTLVSQNESFNATESDFDGNESTIQSIEIAASMDNRGDTPTSSQSTASKRQQMLQQAVECLQHSNQADPEQHFSNHVAGFLRSLSWAQKEMAKLAIQKTIVEFIDSLDN